MPFPSIGDYGPESPPSYRRDPDNVKFSSLATKRPSPAYPDSHGVNSLGRTEHRGELFKLIVNGQTFRDGLHGSAFAQSQAEGLIAGWRSFKVRDIPVVTVCDGNGVTVWTSKETK